MNECSQLELCQREFSRINGKLDRIDESLRGNGKPGVNTRMDRLERNTAIQSRLMWIVIAAVVVGFVGTIFSGCAI